MQTMGIKFRKYITLGKLLRLNISKSGISVTAGVKGASVNIGKNGAYLNTGIPGTGIYSREKLSDSSNKKNKAYSQESLERAQQVLDEYDAQQEQIKLKNKKTDVVPLINMDELDELFLDVVHYVILEDCVSPGRIKSKFNIDYTRTEKIIQQLEENGIISPFSASRGRKVLISTDAFNELKNKLNI